MMKTTPLFFLTIALFCLSAITAGSKVTAQRSADTSVGARADLVLTNGRVWLGGGGSSFSEAVAIIGNQIVQVGSAAEIKKMIGEGTRVIDLGARLAIPGFNDAHIHFLSGALGLDEIDLTGAESVAQMVDRIAVYARKNPEKEWLTGRGWIYALFPGGFPTKSYLDAVIKDRPIFLRAYDGHSGWANSKAMALAGVTRDTKFDEYGEIVRDASGEPTGAFKEGAQRLISRIIPEPTRERKLAALRQGMKLAASLGITSIQNASGSTDEFSLYEELMKRGELTLRVSMAFSTGARTTPQEIDRFIALKKQFESNPTLRANSVKLVFDGVIESHTAAMLERYSDLPTEHGAPFGELTITADIYRDLVARFDKAGFQIYTHAIGDRAAREALNAYEFVSNANNRSNARHRIEHIEVISQQDLPRFARLGVMASMEPIHADPGTASLWSRAVGSERLNYAFAWRSLLRNGAALVFSSDWPAAISLDPIHGLHVAVNRRTIDGKPQRGWVPDQRLSIGDALNAYTLAGAYSTFEEKIKGRIAPGMLADIVVSRRIFSKLTPCGFTSPELS